LVYSIHDSTEEAIQKMIEASQRMIAVNSQVAGESIQEGVVGAAVASILPVQAFPHT
jgi:hypothetical protein